jgi:hypothetical protein
MLAMQCFDEVHSKGGEVRGVVGLGAGCGDQLITMQCFDANGER